MGLLTNFIMPGNLNVILGSKYKGNKSGYRPIGLTSKHNCDACAWLVIGTVFSIHVNLRFYTILRY